MKQLLKQRVDCVGYDELERLFVTQVLECKQLWLRGAYSQSYYAETIEESYLWRQRYIMHVLERILPGLGFNIPMMRMWYLLVELASKQGKALNCSQIGVVLRVTNHTVRHYVNILIKTSMIRILEPWVENISKRQIKSPKVFIRDSGLLHTLVGVQNNDQWQVYPCLGASWEGFALEEIIKINMRNQKNVSFGEYKVVLS